MASSSCKRQKVIRSLWKINAPGALAGRWWWTNGWPLDFQQYWCLPTEVSTFISTFKPQTQGHTISAVICQCVRHLGQCCCWELCAITGDQMWLKQDYAGWGTAHTEDVTALACLQHPITCVNYLWAIACVIDHRSLLYTPYTDDSTRRRSLNVSQ